MRVVTRGFSLVEILVVVAIIGVLAAFALSALWRASVKAHEATAIAHLKQIADAQLAYRQEDRRYGSMEELIGGSYVDRAFVTGVLGYKYAVVLINPEEYIAYADPENPTWRYFALIAGNIHYRRGERPTGDDPRVE